MGLTNSSQSLEEPRLDQPVVLSASAGRRASLESHQESATAVRNPFSLVFDAVSLKPIQPTPVVKGAKSRCFSSKEPRTRPYDLKFPFAAAEAVVIQVLRSRTPPTPLGDTRPEYTRPDTVPADWEHVGATNLIAGTNKNACVAVNLPKTVGDDPPRELLCIHVNPKETAQIEFWEQWYYLTFQPHAEATSGYRLQEWESLMRVGNRVFTVMKIFSSKQDATDTSGTCLVCASEPSTTMVLPCRHLCLCPPCANIIRLKSHSCPVCRGTILSLLELGPTLERRGTV